MWHAAVAVAVGVAVAAVACGGEEYGGGAMPQYGAPEYAAEYHEPRSPDAPPRLHYKYDEELHDSGDLEKAPKYTVEADPWRKPERGRRRSAADEGGEEVESEVRRGGRRGRRNEERRRPPLREAHRPRSYRSRHYGDEAEYQDDPSEEAESTVRARRKARERVFVPPPPPRTAANPSTEGAPDDDEPAERPTKDPGSAGDDSEYWSGAEERAAGRRRPTLPPASAPARAHAQPGRSSTARAYPDYNDYYNSKHVDNSNTNIPNLIRRTTTTATAARAPGPRLEDRAGALPPRLWPSRRAGGGAGPPLSSAVPTSTSTSTSTYAPVAFVPGGNESEPSLAERSRASIAKKAQLKEARGGGGARKPPVLLQATNRVPTVVMVAASDPWGGAREVAGDSPETLERVKRLMRQKLVASAKSIRDLTDNWDDTVCDYIDVAMLEQAPGRAAPRLPPPILPLPLALALLLTKYNSIPSILG